MINWNNWYATIKNYDIDEVYVEFDGEFYYCNWNKLQGTPLWDKINNIRYWLYHNKRDFEFTDAIDDYTYHEYINYMKRSKFNQYDRNIYD